MRNIYICFPEGKHKVLTMSFDDGRVEDRQLVDMFNRYGIRGTFHVNSGIAAETRVPVSEYRELYRGHEVSCHTCTHPTIARCPIEQVVEPVSYTHLDVYKRQHVRRRERLFSVKYRFR